MSATGPILAHVNDQTGVPADNELRRDVRMVTTMLGQTLVRAHGQELLDLVEEVRGLARRSALSALPRVDLVTTTRLVRAFTAYFHLANVTEQVHRGGALLAARADRGGWVEQALGRVHDAGVRPAEVAERLRDVAVRPVLTAHPTEVARRSTLDTMRRVAALLAEPDGPRRRRRLTEAVELMWGTDELRVDRPDPLDEARNGIYYLEGLASAAVPDVLEELRDQLAATDVALPADARPLRFGTWIGGDRDGNPHVTPATTREVLELQAVHGIRTLREHVERLRRELSVSERLSTVSDDVRRRMAEALARLPEVAPRR